MSPTNGKVEVKNEKGEGKRRKCNEKLGEERKGEDLKRLGHVVCSTTGTFLLSKSPFPSNYLSN